MGRFVRFAHATAALQMPLVVLLAFLLYDRNVGKRPAIPNVVQLSLPEEVVSTLRNGAAFREPLSVRAARASESAASRPASGTAAGDFQENANMHRLVRDFMESIFANARRNEFALGKARMRESDGAAEDLQEAFERIAEDFPEGGRHAQPLLERSRDVQNGREGLLDLAETLRKPGSLDLLSATPELFDQIGGTLDSIIGSISRISLASRRQSQGANATDAFSQGGAALDRVLSILERIDALMSSGDSSRGVADGIAGRLDSDVRQERRMRVLLLALFLRDMEAADALLQ